MGICLSCLRPTTIDDAYDETSPLLGDNQSTSALQQQQEELQMEQRNKELNNILNATNEHLIDLTNFLQSQDQHRLQLQQMQELNSQQPQNADYGSTTNIQAPPPPHQSITSLPSLNNTTFDSQQQLISQQQYDTLTSTASNGFVHVEIPDTDALNEEITRDWELLKEKFGETELDRLLAIDVNGVGDLVVKFE